MASWNDLTRELADQNIRPSLQRVMILEYLRTMRNHPTAEQIYDALSQSEQSISLATVYNTLGLFEQKGLLQVLSVGENEHRFDATTKAHGHFLCERCKSVYDFFMDLDVFEHDLPKQFQIRHKGVYFTGICAECAKDRTA